MELNHQHLTLNAKVAYTGDLTKKDSEDFIKKLMKKINMTPLGNLNWADAVDLRFPGQSFVQMITTSHCSLHYFSDVKEIYFDLYSCIEFDDKKVIELLTEKFDLEKWHGILYSRRAGEVASVMEFEGKKEGVENGN